MSVTVSKRLPFMVASIAFLLAAGPAQAQNARRNAALRDWRNSQYARSEHSGTTRESFAVSLCTYDRLVSFGRKQLNGRWVSISTRSPASSRNPMTSARTG